MNILVTMPQGATRDSFITAAEVEKLEQAGHVTWNNSDTQFTGEELEKKIKDADICITGWGCPAFEKNIIDNARKLKLIAHTGGTVASLVNDYVYEKGVRVISGNNMFAESVAEGTLAYILSSLRDIPFYSNEVQQGKWRTEVFSNEGLLDQTIGLIGYGMTARHLVRMLQPFRVKIKVFSGHVREETLAEYGMKKASLEEICATCKIISIHTARRPDTYHMINQELLEKIPDGSLLVNTARGSIVDEKALARELAKGRFKAILDVFEEEPLPADSGLRGLKNVILIPHMAGPTIDRRKFITRGLIEDITRLNEGKPLLYEISRSYAASMTR